MSHKLTDSALKLYSMRLVPTLLRRRHGAGISRVLPRREAFATIAAVVVTLLVAGAAVAEGYHSNPWLLTWVPVPCCVTNDCCWQITESEVRPVAGDRWEILATGQIQPRTGWSPDGKFYRCACDFAEGHWIRHQGANTRCLFVPLRSASR